MFRSFRHRNGGDFAVQNQPKFHKKGDFRNVKVMVITMKKINVLCIFGGRSSEHEVSLSSAYGILENTDIDKYNIYKVGITKKGEWFLYTGSNENIKNGSWIERKDELHPCTLLPGSLLYCFDCKNSFQIDVCFPAIHGGYCEDGRLQGLLDMCNIKYVGPGCASSAICMDKAFTKAILSMKGIPMAKWLVLNKASSVYSSDDVMNALGCPVFVKPANAGSSVGANKATDKQSYDNAVEIAFKEDEKILVEQYICGKEVELAVMGRGENITVSMPGEIDPGALFYDYETKYKNDTAKYYIPARISEETISDLRNYAKIIYTSLDCKGLSRIDFFVTENEDIYFNEINTLPGFTPISMYPKLFISLGMTYSEIIDKLLSNALEGN